MATCVQISRNSCRKLQCPSHLHFPHFRPSSSFAHLHSELKSRRLPLLHDDCSPLPSILLANTLVDFLPPSPIYNADLREQLHPNNILPFAHHLVYFPSAIPLSSLLPDGTDPLHSPGPPFSRRMWAGGTINFPRSPNRIQTGGGAARCMERIRDVTFKGRAGEEKAYVQIERRVRQGPFSSHPRSLEADAEAFPATFDDDDFIELRNLVFMRSDSARSVSGDASPRTLTTPIKLPRAPEISHLLTPTPALLFRFSALTFNAHAIHLDKEYCRAQEGHRNLLVHGPLTVLLMTELLRGHLARAHLQPRERAQQSERTERSEHAQRWETITSVEYRNLAPLYAEEEMRVCGKRGAREGEWELWIEGAEGRVAVRAVARTGVGV